MHLKAFGGMALAVLLALSPSIGFAQTQPIPGAINANGQPANVQGSSLVIAPAGGGAGRGKVVADDVGLPVNCLSGCSGGGGGGTNVGTVGSTAPTSANLNGGKNTAGNLIALCTATDGVLCLPQADGTTLVVRKVTLTANTSTSICLAAAGVITTEIQLHTTVSVGIGLQGQALTTDAWGTGTTAADLIMTTAEQLYTAPLGYKTAITARSTGTPNFTCIQTIRP